MKVKTIIIIAALLAALTTRNALAPITVYKITFQKKPQKQPPVVISINEGDACTLTNDLEINKEDCSPVDDADITHKGIGVFAKNGSFVLKKLTRKNKNHAKCAILGTQDVRFKFPSIVSRIKNRIFKGTPRIEIIGPNTKLTTGPRDVEEAVDETITKAIIKAQEAKIKAQQEQEEANRRNEGSLKEWDTILKDQDVQEQAKIKALGGPRYEEVKTSIKKEKFKPVKALPIINAKVTPKKEDISLETVNALPEATTTTEATTEATTKATEGRRKSI